MIEFYVLAAVLVAASLLFVLIPLWRARTPTPNKRRETNIHIYHQRYAEIEREVAAGRLPRRAAETQKDELGARLLADIDNTPALTDHPRPAARPWLASLVAIVVLGGGAAGVYSLVGTPSAMQAQQMPDVAAMIGKLERRVAENPQDFRARAMLARAQQATGDYAGAAENFHALNEAMPQPRAPVLAAEAGAVLRATDDLQGRARDLYGRVLELDDQNREALWYLGLAASERGDRATAVNYWDRLLAQDLPEDFAQMVRSRRAELAGNKPGLNDD